MQSYLYGLQIYSSGFSDHADSTLCWLLLLTALHQHTKPMEHPPGQQVTVSQVTNVFSYSVSPGTVMVVFSLTGAGLMSVVVVGAFTDLLFVQSGLPQIIIQRSQQMVHVSLVSLQHQFCRTSEGLKEGGSEKTNM